MQKCGNPLHVQVGTKDFMNEIVNLFKMKNLPKQVSLVKSNPLGPGKGSNLDSKVGNQI